jgi:hypothetical protein
MRIQIIAGLVAIAAAFPVLAQEKLQPTALGIGARDCQVWTEGDTTTNQRASEWIMGYWSAEGVNVSTMANGATDYDRLVGKARMYCAAHPSEKIFAAAAAVYGQLAQ